MFAKKGYYHFYDFLSIFHNILVVFIQVNKILSYEFFVPCSFDLQVEKSCKRHASRIISTTMNNQLIDVQPASKIQISELEGPLEDEGPPVFS